MAYVKNRGIPARSKWGHLAEKWLGIPFNLLEMLLAYTLTKPLRVLSSKLDGLSYKIEGTLFKTVLQHTVFPVIIVTSLIVGSEVAKQGFSIASVVDLLALFVVFALICEPLERLIPFSRKWLEGGNDSSVDFMMYFSGAVWSVIAKVLLGVFLISNLVEILEPYGHAHWPDYLPVFVQVFLFLLLKDFFRYWYHRALHEIPFLWRWHAVHHSAERLYWMNGIRSHPAEVIMQAFFYAIPLALLQPPAEVAILGIFMALSIGMFQHANIDAKLGIWEYVFSIGDNHRYHHYPVKGIGDSNYGGEFIVWDIVFGTFHKPKGERPSDTIGIGSAPNYPQTMAGLMIAPFIPDQNVFGPETEEQWEAYRLNKQSEEEYEVSNRGLVYASTK